MTDETSNMDERTELSVVPPATVAMWLLAIPTMDADMLDSFVTRMRELWQFAPEVQRAIDARRIQLELERW